VASGPAAGQYSVAAGVYTFAAADANGAVQISYTYNITGSGEKIAIVNALMGAAPTYKNVFTQAFNGQRHTLVLNACIAGKMGSGSKTEDFYTPEMDFETRADDSNNIGTWSFAESS